MVLRHNAGLFLLPQHLAKTLDAGGELAGHVAAPVHVVAVEAQQRIAFPLQLSLDCGYLGVVPAAALL